MENKDIKDYLHLYLGCECQLYMGEGEEPLKVLLTIYNFNYYKHVLDDLTPILRPLSDMTDEERGELWNFVFRRPFHKNGSTAFIDKVSTLSDPRWVLSSGVERLGIELNGTVWADSDLHIWKHNQHEVTLYLLKQGFDLFGLIKAGLAIDKTKIEHNGTDK